MQAVAKDVNTTQVLKALADEVRLSIVRKLAQNTNATCGCDVTACKSVPAMSQPTMSHHFSKLVEAGVLLEEKRGTQKMYTLNTALLESMGINVSKLWKEEE